MRKNLLKEKFFLFISSHSFFILFILNIQFNKIEVLNIINKENIYLIKIKEKNLVIFDY
jgi:hypothetical protein